MAQQPSGGKLFYSYHPSDHKLYEGLTKHLSPLAREKGLSETYIPAGAAISQERKRLLENAALILLLISPDYLADCDEEMQAILQLSQREDVRAIPILLRPCDLQSVPSLTNRQRLPRDGRAVTQWNDWDLAFRDIVQEIRRMLKTFPRPVISHSAPDSEDQHTALPEGKHARLVSHFSGQSRQETIDFSVSSQLFLPKRALRIVAGLFLLLFVLIGGSFYGVLYYSAARKHSPIQTTATVRVHVTATTSTASAQATIPPQTQWHTQTIDPPQMLASVAWSGSRFVAVGWHGTILTSFDGLSWRLQTSPDALNLYGVAWLNSQFVVTGEEGAILTSSDGHSWNLPPTPSGQDLHGIAWSGSRFVVVGVKGTILTSPDGRSWTTQPSGLPNALDDVTWCRSQFVAVGWPNLILTSPDGINWTSQTPDPTQNLSGVACSGSQSVVVGRDGKILTSSDGLHWTLQTSNTSQDLTAVTWFGSQFVAVGISGTLLTSPNGIAWTPQNTGTQQNLRGISQSDSRFVAVGDNGTILTSS
jgi:photosystem II stability/assembly factor-like uncharacterized protein